MQHDKHLSPFPRLVAWKDGMALARNCGRNPRPDLWAFILVKEVYYNFIYLRLHVLASSGLGLAAPAAQAQGWACLADAHPNFTGISKGLAANGSSTRSDLNDKISSFKIVQGCRVIRLRERGLQGPKLGMARKRLVCQRQLEQPYFVMEVHVSVSGASGAR